MSNTDPIAALTAQLAAIQEQLAAATTAQAEPKPQRALPTVGEVVTYTDTASTGLTRSRRGIVTAVDEEHRQADINWLPDAEATLPVDDLD